MASFKKLMSDYGLGVLIILLLVALVVGTMSDYFTGKSTDEEGMIGGEEGDMEAPEEMDNMAGGNEGDMEGFTGEINPAELSGSDLQSKSIQNPADLLPTDSNSSFADLAPNSADLNNSSLLSAGHHIGSGGSDAPLRNSNLQLRGEVANPRAQVGPWNQSTIEPDTHRKGICA
jgi:hypothetical protein